MINLGFANTTNASKAPMKPTEALLAAPKMYAMIGCVTIGMTTCTVDQLSGRHMSATGRNCLTGERIRVH